VRILLIEDDEILADRLVESLTQHQYVVDAIADGQEGLNYAESASYDLIISDVGLPGMDGITLCSRLRKAGSSTPILLMTAKDAPDERIRGLDAGADDHLTKPLNLDELHARVRALLRRGEVAPETVLQAGALRLDPVSCQVTYGSTLLKLTPKEYSLLELFMRSPNRVFSRSHIIEHLWSFDDPPLEDSVKAHIKGLRRKLKQVGTGDWVENVYGLGYRFTPEESDTPTESLPAPAVPAPAAPSFEQGASPTETKLPVAFSQDETTASSSATPTPSSSNEQIYKDSLAGLWRKYQGLMTQRVEALTQAVEAIQHNHLASNVKEQASHAAHKLAGVLGMFELDEGSDLARDIETRFEAGTEDNLAQIPALVQRLVELIQLEPPQTPEAIHLSSDYTLLVSTDRTLVDAVQTLAQGTDSVWYFVSSLEDARKTIQESSPTLVIVDIPAASQWTQTIEFIRQLAATSPTLPTLAITTTDSLIDRVAMAQAGINRLLVKPVTATQVWQVATELQTLVRGLTAQVLVVDDDPLIAKVLRSLLEPWGLGVTGLEQPQQFWDVLRATHPDLLILDVEMPEFSGIELCQAVRTDPEWQHLPVLFLTAHRDSDTVQEVFRAGADDYTAKPIIGPELVTRILNRLERARLLRHLSSRDAITQLWNYPHSRQVINQALDIARTNETPFSLAVIVLDDLAAVNLRYGHDVGQAILQSWGQCFQGAFPDHDLVGYWGNGEFVVGLLDQGQAMAEESLQPLFQILRRQVVNLPGGERIQPTFTQSVVTFPEQGQTLHALYQAAVGRG
jgi:diguanylate cyclase (GGDEF)-like protein